MASPSHPLCLSSVLLWWRTRPNEPNIIIIGLVSLAPWVIDYIIGHVDVAGFSPHGRGASISPAPTVGVFVPIIHYCVIWPFWSYGIRPLRASAWKTLVWVFMEPSLMHPVKRPGRFLWVIGAAQHLPPALGTMLLSVGDPLRMLWPAFLKASRPQCVSSASWLVDYWAQYQVGSEKPHSSHLQVR